MKLRVTVDTNVLVSHFLLPGRNPSKVMDQALAGKVELVLSDFILDEMEAVLLRKAGFDGEAARRARTSIRRASEIVKPRHAVSIIREDESDNNILECALSGRAHVLVSGDHHLLALREYQGVRILTPRHFLEEFVK
jgi:putative PIN family toxin of toxin-antitoxin system